MILFNSKTVKALFAAMVAITAIYTPSEAFATATVWTGSNIKSVAGTSTDVYLYNVKEGKFLGKGGKWGTQAVMSEVGLPFTVSKSGDYYILTSHATAQGATGNTKGVLGFTNGTNATSDTYRFFTDRNQSKDSNYGTFKLAFDGATPTTDNKGVGKTFYTISLTSKGASDSNLNGTFYMYAGTDTEFSNIAAPMGTKTKPTDDSQIWQIVTLADRRNAFTNTEVSGNGQVPATFLIHDQDFSRNQSTISYWKDNNYNTDMTNTNWDCYPYQAYTQTVYTYTYSASGSHDASYYDHSGYNFDTWDGWLVQYTHNYNITKTVISMTPPNEIAKTITEKAYCGGSVTGDHKHTSEEITVTFNLVDSATVESTGYTYYVGNGYIDDNATFDKEKNETLTNAKNLQEDYGNKWTANIHGANGNVAQSVSTENMVREGWYEISCQAFTTANQGTVQLFASVGGVKEGTGFYTEAIKKGEDMSIAEADKESNTYVMAYDRLHGATANEADHTYNLLVKVGKTSEGIQSLSFGIQVIDAEATAWTCFDNFTITYLGNSQFNLYLDETNEDIANIQNQAIAYDSKGKKYAGNRTLYLNRQFNLNKWNTIVLPVSLTAEQVKSGFGENVKLSEFYGANEPNNPTRIIFEGVDLTNDKAVAMKAGNLYLIKPASDMKKDKTFTIDVITGTEGTKNTIENKKINQAYIVNQVNVDFDNTLSASVTTDSKGSDSEIYDDDVNMVKFVGTYVAGTIIPENSYVIAGKDTKNAKAGYWYFRPVTTSSKGFRGWLETYKNQGNAKLTYVIDGVEETAEGATSSIAEAFTDGEKIISGNIYSISGQLVRKNATSVEGLPAGIYVNNGMKIIVK